MIVPEGGRGEIWQVSVPLRRVRQALGASATVVTVLLVLAAVQAATLSRVLDHDTLVGENLALRTRLDQVDRQLGQLDPLIQRVKVYDEHLRELEARNALPGFGPLDDDENAARQAWIDAVVPTAPPRSTRDLSPEIEVAGVEARMAALSDDVQALLPGLDGFEDVLDRYEALHAVLPQIWPVDGAVLTSPFGYRDSPFGHAWKFHTGVDLGVPSGTPIYATNDGLVTFAGWDQGHGNMVVIDHGHEVTTRYCHASRLLVGAGDQVAAGDVIALVGSTGQSTGPHLHYEILLDGEKVDPLEYLP
jgi:hypothetical protein